MVKLYSGNQLIMDSNLKLAFYMWKGRLCSIILSYTFAKLIASDTLAC